jgi:hypothetical protein
MWAIKFRRFCHTSAWVRQPITTATLLLLHAAFDPMLEEFTASFVASPPTRACSTAPEGASQEVDISLVDTRSPVKTAQWMADSPPPSHVQGPPLVTLSPGGATWRQPCIGQGCHLGKHDSSGYHGRHQQHPFPTDELRRRSPQEFHRASHEGEATAAPGVSQR